MVEILGTGLEGQIAGHIERADRVTGRENPGYGDQSAIGRSGRYSAYTRDRLIGSESKPIGGERGQVEGSRRIVETEVDVRARRNGRSGGDDDLTTSSNKGAAGVTVGSCEGRRPSAVLDDITAAGDRVGEDQVVGVIEGERAVVGDRTGADHAVGGPVTHHQGRIRGDERLTGIAVAGDQLERAGADLIEGAHTADYIGKGVQTNAVKDEGSVVEDRSPSDGSIGSATADLKGSISDRGGAGVVVRSGQNRRASTDKGERTGTGDRVAEKQGAALVKDQQPVVD